jgi:hypothetical protein
MIGEERDIGGEPVPDAEVIPDGEVISDAELVEAEVIPEETAEVLPAVLRLSAEMWLRATAWGVGSSLRAGAKLARAAADPGTAAELVEDVTGGVRAYAREFLGISDLDEQVSRLTPLGGNALRANGTSPELALRSRGAELLRQAADVSYDDGAHPAYARILTELAPDEARILRLLAAEGPQAVVDIRAANLIGLGSQLIAPGLNMVGAQAGARHRDRVPAYLNNLTRLGLVHTSDEAIADPVAYQVLEAQPDVLGTIKETARAKSVHRSLELTPFGKDFCAVCLPLEPPALPAGEL